jgi:hypothetical protein
MERKCLSYEKNQKPKQVAKLPKREKEKHWVFSYLWAFINIIAMSVCRQVCVCMLSLLWVNIRG